MEDLTENPGQPRAKKRPVGVLILFAIAGVAVISVMAYFSQKSAFMDYNYTLMMAAKAQNIACPRMVDEITRLDSVTAKRDKQLIYYYTFLTLKKDELDSAFCNRWNDGVRAATKGMEGVEEFGKNGVTLVYKGRDENGIDLCEVAVAAEHYYHPSR